MILNDILLSKPNDRVFVFQNLSKFTDVQLKYIENKLQGSFFPNWYSHDFKLSPRLMILHNHFLIISTCAPNISGCAIDALTHVIRDIELELKISLLNRLYIPYFTYINNQFTYDDICNIEIKFKSYKDLKHQSSIYANSNIFILNTRIGYGHETWILSFQDWLSKYMQK